jgi:hypothetical protein
MSALCQEPTLAPQKNVGMTSVLPAHGEAVNILIGLGFIWKSRTRGITKRGAVNVVKNSFRFPCANCIYELGDCRGVAVRHVRKSQAVF